MTDFQQRKLSYLFSLLDINRNGFLQLSDFSDIADRLLEKTGYELQSKQHRFVVEKCVGLFYRLLKDIKSGTREVQLYHWLEFFEKSFANEDADEVLDSYVQLFFSFIFQMFDENNDGYISQKEYRDIFEIYNIDHMSIDAAFEAMDSYKDGRLSRYELKHAIETFFTSDDPTDSRNYIFGDFTRG